MKKRNAKTKKAKKKIRKRQGGRILKKKIVKKGTKLRGTTYSQPEYKVIPNTTFASDKPFKATSVICLKCGKVTTEGDVAGKDIKLCKCSKTGTTRMKKALKIISENLGNPKKIKEELMNIGYTESYLDSGQMKNTQGFQDLVEKELPDGLLLGKHKALIEKQEVVTKNNNKSGKIDVVKTGEIDVTAVRHGLDMAYKLKKKYGDTTIIHKFGGTSDEELEAEIARDISEGLGEETGTESEKGKQQS